MEVLIVNGSPRVDGNSSYVVKELAKTFKDLGVNVNIVNIGNKPVRGCVVCNSCKEEHKCVFNDVVNDALPLFEKADGLIIVSPVYYASPNGSVISFLDRLFYSKSFDVRMKVGASFNIARRGGTEASFDVVNKYFTISGMPIASGDYWNNIFGRNKGEVEKDAEGLRNVRIVAKRMVFLMKAIKDAKEKYPELLNDEPRAVTDFVKK